MNDCGDDARGLLHEAGGGVVGRKGREGRGEGRGGEGRKGGSEEERKERRKEGRNGRWREKRRRMNGRGRVVGYGTVGWVDGREGGLVAATVPVP